MNRNVTSRLLKLERERGVKGLIPYLCEDEAEFEAMVEADVGSCVIRTEDIPRCRPWWQVPASFSSLTHEEALEHLQ